MSYGLGREGTRIQHIWTTPPYLRRREVTDLYHHKVRDQDPFPISVAEHTSQTTGVYTNMLRRDSQDDVTKIREAQAVAI
jgi:hypothetical protein